MCWLFKLLPFLLHSHIASSSPVLIVQDQKGGFTKQPTMLDFRDAGGSPGYLIPPEAFRDNASCLVLCCVRDLVVVSTNSSVSPRPMS